jgi:outer membrane beta-barrel protein
MRLALCLAALVAVLSPARAHAQYVPGPESEVGTGPVMEPQRRRTLPESEADAAHEDRVKSVQRKPFLKRGRFELTPLGFVTLNDAFFPKYGPAARLGYHLHDSFAAGVRLNQYNLIPSQNVRLAKRQFQAALPAVQPKYALALDLIWSPFYGKVAVFNSIRHFDLYILGGAGLVHSQTSDEDGLHLSSHLGLGQRFSVTDFMMIDLALVETLYADRPGAGQRVQLQHGLSIQAGVSFFIPFSSRYKEP